MQMAGVNVDELIFDLLDCNDRLLLISENERDRGMVSKAGSLELGHVTAEFVIAWVHVVIAQLRPDLEVPEPPSRDSGAMRNHCTRLRSLLENGETGSSPDPA